MPELPEVEIVRLGLMPSLTGRRIVRAETRRPDLRFPFPERFASRLSGQRIEALSRRAKYLLAHLSSGETLVIHLGMSGRLSLARPGESMPRILGDYVYDTGASAAHDHAVLRLEDGTVLTYNDPRRFGFMLLVAEADRDDHPLFRGLGPEPLSEALTAGYLSEQAARRRTALKSFLMDQRVVAGLGNIYVAEALHRARLSPARSAASLAGRGNKAHARAEALVAAIRSVLADAIAAGGSTLRDFRQADGREGGFQNQHLVYDRAGEPCATPACRGIVRRSMTAGRATFYCPVCQK